jgi:hypothetical protein
VARAMSWMATVDGATKLRGATGAARAARATILGGVRDPFDSRLCIECFSLPNGRAGHLLLVGVRRAVGDREQAWIGWDAQIQLRHAVWLVTRLLSNRDVTTEFAARLKV